MLQNTLKTLSQVKGLKIATDVKHAHLINLLYGRFPVPKNNNDLSAKYVLDVWLRKKTKALLGNAEELSFWDPGILHRRETKISS